MTNDSILDSLNETKKHSEPNTVKWQNNTLKKKKKKPQKHVLNF